MGPRPLHALDSGEGSPTLVLLHGYGATGFTWRNWVAKLESSHRVLNIDLKGFGRSRARRGGGFGPSDHAEAVLATLEAQGVEDPVLVGHSLGGGIALLTALAMKDRRDSRLVGMILMSSAAYAHRIPPFVRLARVGRAGQGFLGLIPKEFLIRKILDQVQSPQHPPTTEAIAGYAAPLRQASHRFACVETALQIFPPDLDALVSRYPEIDVPVLLIWGDQDRVCSPWVGTRLARELPHAELAVVSNCGHMPQDEHPQETLGLVTRFLENLERAEGRTPGNGPPGAGGTEGTPGR